MKLMLRNLQRARQYEMENLSVMQKSNKIFITFNLTLIHLICLDLQGKVTSFYS